MHRLKLAIWVSGLVAALFILPALIMKVGGRKVPSFVSALAAVGGAMIPLSAVLLLMYFNMLGIIELSRAFKESRRGTMVRVGLILLLGNAVVGFAAVLSVKVFWLQ